MPFFRLLKLLNLWHIQLVILVIVMGVSWVAIHQRAVVPPDIYPYLTSLPPNLVLECQERGQNLTSYGWADLLAIKSTIPDRENQSLIEQLERGIDFAGLSWNRLNLDLVKQVKYRREILIRYPYYQPRKYTFPVMGEPYFQNTFGASRSGAQRQHEGTDLFSKEGTPIINVTSGVVERLGWNRLGGERVGVRGDDGNYYYYAHLQQISPLVHLNSRIERGELIGTMGHTGDALTTPDHLHFGIELPDGQWINPYPFLVVWQASSSETPNH